MDELTLGNLLREKRTSLGLSIDQVAGATHIPSQFLEALENEEFDVIPGEGYVKGFLRTYGDYLELDPDPIVDMYNTRHGNGTGPKPLFPWSRGAASKDSIARLRWRLLPATATERRENLIVWLLICATLVAIWVLYYYLVVRVANLNVEIDTSSLFDESRCLVRHSARSLIAAVRSIFC